MKREPLTYAALRLIVATTVIAMAFAGQRVGGGPGGGGSARARACSSSSRYADALAIYTHLYARTHHPTYLRNTGRCHQMLREPEPAIAVFPRYLHDAHDLPAPKSGRRSKATSPK